jgi:DNA (cytosine-5)-methyltransferase 1
MTSLRLIDLFAGIGGMTCGFLQARSDDLRFEPVFAVEWDPFAAAIYRANFGDHVLEDDIARVESWPAAEVVIGGPPCQGFSPLGRDRSQEQRAELNSLWRHYVEALREIRPLVWVMENVPELLKSHEGAEFLRVVKEELGYAVRAEVLNAADYGVAQLRRRAIVVGSRIGSPPWPERRRSPETYTTVRQALRGLPLEPDERSWHRSRPNIRPTSIERYRQVPEGGNRFDLMERRPDLTPQCWLNKKTGTTDVFGRLWWDRPAFTIRTEFYKPEKGRYLHPEAHRPITVREAASLQGFPRTARKPPVGFILPEDLPMVQVAKGIGNAVPPPLARAIGEAVLRHVAEPVLSELEHVAAA